MYKSSLLLFISFMEFLHEIDLFGHFETLFDST